MSKSKTERTLAELYQDDPERADAVVFGRRAEARPRGFPGGAGAGPAGGGGGAEGYREIYGPLRRRSAPFGRPDQGCALPGHADPQGHGGAQPYGLGHERRAAAQHPWRAGASRRTRLAGVALAQMAQEDHDP